MANTALGTDIIIMGFSFSYYDGRMMYQVTLYYANLCAYYGVHGTEMYEIDFDEEDEEGV